MCKACDSSKDKAGSVGVVTHENVLRAARSGIILRRRAERRDIDADRAADGIMEGHIQDVAAEMRSVFDEQEEEVQGNLIKVALGAYLTADLLLDHVRWFDEIPRRLSAYVRPIMDSARCVGMAFLGRKCEGSMLDLYVDRAVQVLYALNESITTTTRDKLLEMAEEYHREGKSVEEFGEEIRDLFTGWRVWRSHAVSVFNVTHPFNSALFQTYLNAGVDFKMWVNQEMIGNTYEGQVRDTHLAAGGQVVRIGSPFEVGNAFLMYPGDISQISQNPEELHGCRCMVKPVLDFSG